MNPATSPPKTELPKHMRRVVTTVLVFGVVVSGLWLLGHLFPRYTGSEFSPYSFNIRDFEMRKGYGATVLQPSKLACSTDISKHLTMSATAAGANRWDLVECLNAFQHSEKFEASLLIDAFETRDSNNDLFWEKWSKDHPAHAKILWPAVQQLAIHRSYFAIPRLLQQASMAKTPEELNRLIVATSLQAGVDQAHRELAKHELDSAKTTLEWAKTFGRSTELDLLDRSIREALATRSDDLR